MSGGTYALSLYFFTLTCSDKSGTEIVGAPRRAKGGVMLVVTTSAIVVLSKPKSYKALNRNEMGGGSKVFEGWAPRKPPGRPPHALARDA